MGATTAGSTSARCMGPVDVAEYHMDNIGQGGIRRAIESSRKSRVFEDCCGLVKMAERTIGHCGLQDRDRLV
jgi:hypothetical protein